MCCSVGDAPAVSATFAQRARGGALYVVDSALAVTSSAITTCAASSGFSTAMGGALFVDGSVVTFHATVIRNSSAVSTFLRAGGGAVYVVNLPANVTLIGCTISNAIALSRADFVSGGAIFATLSSIVKLFGCLVQNSRASSLMARDVHGGAVGATRLVILSFDRCVFSSCTVLSAAADRKVRPQHLEAHGAATVTAHSRSQHAVPLSVHCACHRAERRDNPHQAEPPYAQQLPSYSHRRPW